MSRKSLSLVATILAASMMSTAEKRPAEPNDCVKTRYLLGNRFNISIKIDHGSRVVYLVKEAHIESNQNIALIYVKSLSPREGMGELTLRARYLRGALAEVW